MLKIILKSITILVKIANINLLDFPTINKIYILYPQRYLNTFSLIIIVATQDFLFYDQWGFKALQDYVTHFESNEKEISLKKQNTLDFWLVPLAQYPV